MRRTIFSAMLIVPLAVFVCFLASVRPEMLEHHGMTADSEGSADYCLACHDGKTAKRASTINSHKFLIKYPPAGKEKNYATQQAALAAGVRLENGMVTCISCHDLRNPLKYHYAIDTTPFAKKLCYACHIKIDPD